MSTEGFTSPTPNGELVVLVDYLHDPNTARRLAYAMNVLGDMERTRGEDIEAAFLRSTAAALNEYASDLQEEHDRQVKTFSLQLDDPKDPDAH